MSLAPFPEFAKHTTVAATDVLHSHFSPTLCEGCTIPRAR
jgi:hypothetical protein